MQFLTISILSMFMFLLSTEDQSLDQFIVNGRKALEDEWPFMAAIWIKVGNNSYKPFWCGASIIAQQWALSAAHCFRDEFLKKEFVLYAGHTSFLKPDGKFIYAIEKIERHPDYEKVSYNMDISLIKLNQTIDFSKNKGRIAPIAIVKDEKSFNQKVCFTMGWGKTENLTESMDLNEMDLEIEKNWTTKYFYYSNATKARIIQVGDTGGPMVCAVGRDSNNQIQYGLVGIASRVNQNWSGFTNVPRYRDWIKKTLKLK